MIDDLSPAHFAAFFEAVHGVPPFPWQRRLADLVCAGDGWPTALDVPTGAGKTSAIDIAVFHLALEAARGRQRRAPLRIVFVVDRRLVVDDAYARALRLSNALTKPASPEVAAVAKRLGLLAERADRPLRVARLRGGAPKEPDWARTPAQPTVLVSTVDQVGSRVLFRGYGVSASMRPVHAGLLGADALYLLDEAHLSQPFVETMRDARRMQLRGAWSEDRAAAPFGVVTLSATQSERAPPLVLDDDRAHPVLGPRLSRSKVAELVLVREESGDDGFADAFVQRAWGLSAYGGGAAKVVGVVVNRVRRARLVFDALAKRLSALGVGDGVALLTGRSREVDRAEQLSKLLPRMAAGRDATTHDAPLIVVATQCVEAGADLDFDALVTEIAPLDSLRQRFGRLNRMGRPIEVSAAVLAAADQVGPRAKPDVVYDTCLADTWKALETRATARGKGKGATLEIDFGILAAAGWLPSGSELTSCIAPRADAPVLMPAFVHRWAQTSPAPEADADVSLFLHGPDAAGAEVQVAWRADLVEEEPEDRWLERVAVCPPSAHETIELPIWEVRRWLSGRGLGAELVDVEGARVREGAGDEARCGKAKKLVRYRAGETPKVTGVDGLRPGDLIVVPASFGGCDAWGWQPGEGASVRDRAREAAKQQRGHDVIRLSAPLVELALLDEQVDGTEASRRAGRFARSVEELREETDAAVLQTLAKSSDLPHAWRVWIDEGDVEVVRAEADGLPLALRRRVSGTFAGEATTEDDAGSIGVRRSVPLDEHSRGVAEMAEIFAERCGLDDALRKDVALAAFLHDAGKAHASFKCWLYGGDELAAIAGAALAKSGRLRLGSRPRQLARLPNGARHEVASLSFAMAHPRLAEAHDSELVLWLIGTHHGWGRPFFPPVEWPAPGESFAVDLGDGSGTVTSAAANDLASLQARWIDLQARLTSRYGPWGLARLEAIIRLADHRRSEKEQEA